MTDIQRGPWHPDFDRFFGVKRIMRYGLADQPAGHVIRWTVKEAFGDLAPGEELAFKVAGPVDSHGVVRVTPNGATVLAVDQDGAPALLSRPVGAGRIVLATAPLEQFEAATPGVNPAATARLYRALAVRAGAIGQVQVHHPAVFAELLYQADGAPLIVVVSQQDSPVQVELTYTPPGAPTTHLHLNLEAYGIRVIRPDGTDI